MSANQNLTLNGVYNNYTTVPCYLLSYRHCYLTLCCCPVIGSVYLVIRGVEYNWKFELATLHLLVLWWNILSPGINYGYIVQVSVNFTPTRQFSRFKNDRPIPKDSRIKSTINVDEELATLQITESKLSDAGSYKIVATNDIGQVQSNCQVTVNCECHYQKHSSYSNHK